MRHLAISSSSHPACRGRLAPPAALLVVGMILAAPALAAVDSGTYTGDGAFNRVIGGLAFEPAMVIVKGDGADSAIIRTSSMPTFYSRHLVGDWGLLTARIHAFTEDGFRLGSDADVNASGREYWWIAFSEDPGFLAVGSYEGDGADAREVAGLGFEPGVLLLAPHGATECRFRSATMPGTLSLPFGPDSGNDDTVTGLTADGFTVADEANLWGEDYSYVALATAGGATASGSYTGDGTVGREVEGAGFDPRWVVTKQAGSKAGAHLTTELSGADQTLNFLPEANFAGGILELDDDGFVVGAHERVNEDGQDYHWLAFASRDETADLATTLGTTDPAPELGDSFTVTATIANAGPADADAATLQVDVPDGLVLESLVAEAGWVADNSTPTAVSIAWDLPAGEQRQVAATYRVDHGPATRTFASRCTAGLPDPDPGNDEDSLALAIPTVDVAVTLASSDTSPVAGDAITLTAQVSNAAAALSADVVATVAIPVGMTVDAATPDAGAYDLGTGVWDVGPLAAATSATLVLDVTVGADQDGNTLTPEITATGSRNDDDLADNTATLPHAVGGGADLAAFAAFTPTAAGPGDAVDLAFTVTNAGPDAAASFTGTVTLPAGLAHASHVADVGVYDDDASVWTGPALSVGDAVTLTVTCTVTSQDAGDVQATATVAAPETDPVPANDSATAALQLHGAHDLAPTASWSPASVTAGATTSLEVVLANAGPGAAPGATTTVVLPAGCVQVGQAADLGSYDPDTGVWTISDPLPAAGSWALTIDVVTPADGLGDADASVALAAQDGETTPGNDTAVATLALVQQTDLAAALAFDVAEAGVGDPVTVTVAVANAGPSAASPFATVVTLPPALSLQTSATSNGTYAGGVWNTATALGAGDTAALELLATATGDDAGPVSVTATATAAGSDPDPANDDAAASIDLHGAYDLAVTLAQTPVTADPGDTLQAVIALANAGPGASATPQVDVALPAPLAFLDATATSGAFAAATGAWSLGDGLAAAAAETLVVRLLVPDGAVGVLATSAAVAALPGDTDPSNDTTTVTVTVIAPADVRVASVPFGEDARTLLPGGEPADVLRLRLHNEGGGVATLDSITLRNPTGDGIDQATLDACWASLGLRGVGLDRDLAGFAAGAVTAIGLGLVIAPGDSLDLVVQGAAAVDAPDGVELQPTLASAADLGFAGDVPPVAGEWPLIADGVLAVDGMSAAQITLHPVGAEIFQMGSVRNLALDVTVPANGAEADVMTKLNVVNAGTAVPGDAITRVEAWRDDGDGLFDPAADALIGELHWTGGQRWEATSLAMPVPAGGQRVLVTVDVAEDALGGNVQLGLPAADDPAIGMLSGNDGPIDEPVDNPWAQTITATDKIILSTATLNSRTVAPGETAVPLLALTARNLYADTHRLERLRVRNQTVGEGDPDQAALDAVTGAVRLHRDGNGNGVFDGPASDPVMASTTWDAGIAAFDGVDWELPADTPVSLFVTTSVSLLGAAERDTIGAVIGAIGDLVFARDVAVVGAWPLDSGARHVVDGLVAAQLACPAVPPVSLTASEGPVLALDLTVPGNGHRGDTLATLRLRNLGTAVPDDVADLGLWADDGDGLFDPAGDTRVADLTGVDASWVALDLDLPVPAGGQRLFAGLTVADTPTDSSTVRLSVPVDGVTMASDHDGPLDGAVASPTSLLISTAPLLSTMTFASDRSTTDMTVTVTMRVTNVGSEAVEAITPSAIALTGDGSLAQVSGPTPATLDLDADGATGTFTWTYAATSAGAVYATGRCEGVSAVGGQPRGSLATASAPHRVLQPALDLALYPVVNMPFSINRGQSGVVPLTLTLLNEGGENRAEIALRRLVVTLDDGDGNPVVPADLLSRVTIGEGVNVYGDVTSPETTGQTITLDLAPEVVVTASEPVTLGLRLDISNDTTIERFRVGLAAADHITVVDRVSGAARDVTLTEGAFPVQSAAGSIVAQATGLVATAASLPDRTAGAGQDAVELLRLDLAAEGEDTGSEVKVGSFAVSVTDTAGHRLADAASRLARLWVEGPLAVHDLHLLEGAADSLVVFELSPAVTVPVSAAAVQVSVHGRLTDDPVLGPLVLHLEGADRFDARDGNVSTNVGVTYQPATIDGPRVDVQQPAPALLAAVIGHLPASLAQGARGVAALDVELTHPGAATTAAARLDTLRLGCLDESRQPLAPGTMLDGHVVTWNGAEVGAPVIHEGTELVVPLGGRLLAPGRTGTLAVHVDIEADAPARGIELILRAGDLVARDANLDQAVAVAAAPGAQLPGTSGLARIRPAAEDVVASWTDRLPALLPSGGDATLAAILTLRNTSPDGTAPALLTGLSLRAADRDLTPAAAGALLAGGEVRVGSDVWADAAQTAEADSTLQLVSAEPLPLAAGDSIDLEVWVTPRPAAASGLRLGLRPGDVACLQTDGATPVPVRAAEGASLPFWTEASGLAAQDLAASYINFPNPFAAGRQSTRFAFQLPGDGRVSLRIWTARGDPVVTLLDDHGLAAGLHQDLAWDGRNGRGTPVRNGVYLAELRVEFAAAAASGCCGRWRWCDDDQPRHEPLPARRADRRPAARLAARRLVAARRPGHGGRRRRRPLRVRRRRRQPRPRPRRRLRGRGRRRLGRRVEPRRPGPQPPQAAAGHADLAARPRLQRAVRRAGVPALALGRRRHRLPALRRRRHRGARRPRLPLCRRPAGHRDRGQPRLCVPPGRRRPRPRRRREGAVAIAGRLLGDGPGRRPRALVASPRPRGRGRRRPQPRVRPVPAQRRRTRAEARPGRRARSADRAHGPGLGAAAGRGARAAAHRRPRAESRHGRPHPPGTRVAPARHARLAGRLRRRHVHGRRGPGLARPRCRLPVRGQSPRRHPPLRRLGAFRPHHGREPARRARRRGGCPAGPPGDGVRRPAGRACRRGGARRPRRARPRRLARGPRRRRHPGRARADPPRADDARGGRLGGSGWRPGTRRGLRHRRGELPPRPGAGSRSRRRQQRPGARADRQRPPRHARSRAARPLRRGPGRVRRW